MAGSGFLLLILLCPKGSKGAEGETGGGSSGGSKTGFNDVFIAAAVSSVEEPPFHIDGPFAPASTSFAVPFLILKNTKYMKYVIAAAPRREAAIIRPVEVDDDSGAMGEGGLGGKLGGEGGLFGG